MSVGTELAAARERLGLSREDVSQRTKISVERLLAIEQMELPNLPPLVYLKGFVREYATAVQLDPDLVTPRYLLEFDEPAGLIAREPEAGDDPAPPDSRDDVDDVPLRDAEPLTTRVIPSRASATDLFESEDDIVPDPIETAASRYDLPSDSPPRDDLVSSDDVPIFGATQAPPRTGFRGGFIAVAVAVLAGILIAAYGERVGFLYPRKVTSTTDSRARTPSPIRPDAAPASRASESPSVESAARATNTRPIEPPPAAPAPEARADEPAAAPSAPTPRPSVATPSAATPAPDARAVPSPPARLAAPSAVAPVNPPAPVAEPPTAATTPSPRATVAGREATAPSSDNLTGNWSLTTRIEVTEVSAFENMNLGFRLQLRQDGERIAGRGIRWMENGKLIPERSRTSIFIGGIRRGNRLELRFTEHGTARTSTGTFVMDVGDDGTLRGQFASTSENSSGSTIARRATPEER